MIGLPVSDEDAKKSKEFAKEMTYLIAALSSEPRTAQQLQLLSQQPGI